MESVECHTLSFHEIESTGYGGLNMGSSCISEEREMNHKLIASLTSDLSLQDNQTNRTLTLISKTIQYLGNLVSSRSAQPCKEEYTGQLYRMFSTEEHIEAVKQFLEMISSTDENQGVDAVEPVLLKEG